MNTRLVAARVLVNVLQNGLSLTAALDAALQPMAVGKDRAFIQALCYGVMRYFHRLDFILAQLLETPLKDPDVKALALVGLYQLAFMRVKPHAAVSETVSAQKKAWAKPLLNALLRRYLREQQALEQLADQQASAANSHPNWLIKQLQQQWPEQAAAILVANNQQPPMTLRINAAKTNRDDYLQQLAVEGIDASVIAFCPSAIQLDKPVNVEALPQFAEGWVSVQDSAAQLAAGLLSLAPEQRVLDVCAAPGGKTAHILESQPQLQELLAVDIDAKRLQRVGDNLQRLGLIATQLVGDASKPESWWDGQLFDRILLDVPCSATGVIRRHPDIKVLRKPDDIEALANLQQAIVAAIWPLLATGGRLLYATCSVLKQENEQQIDKFLTSYTDAIHLPINAQWGQQRPFGRQILPGENGMDGFYYALLEKR